MKTILFTLHSWVSLGAFVLGIHGGAVHAQRGQRTEPLVTTNNCTTYILPVRISYRSVKWSGECKNGKLHGPGVYTFEYQISSPFSWWQKAEIGYWDNGTPVGVTLTASCVKDNKPECLILQKIEISGTSKVEYFHRDFKNVPNASPPDIEIITGVIRQFEAEVNDLPTVKTAELLDLMKAWVNDPEMTLSTFINRKPSAARLTPRVTDDPKVFGRSARGS